MTSTPFSAMNELFDADELLALARMDVERGALDQALWRLKLTLTEAQPPSEAQSMIARLYAQMGLHARAQAHFTKYLELSPGSLVETFQLGMSHFEAGETQRALSIWEELLKDHPTHPPALYYKALALAQTQKVGEARQALEILLQSAPADNLYFGRGKELLSSLEAGGRMAGEAGAQASGASPVIPKDIYKTEH